MSRVRLVLTLVATGLLLSISVPPQVVESAGRPETGVTAVTGSPHDDTSQTPSAAGNAVSQAANLIQQARELGLDFLRSKNDQSKKAAKKSLEQAEKLLKKELKADAACERCLEQLALTYFYQSLFGISNKYGDCTETAEKGLVRYPNNAQLAYIKAAAHYNCGAYSEAVKALKIFLAVSRDDPQTEENARKLLQESQGRFLNSWYKQANFYQSPESRIEAINPQTAQRQIVFQATPEWEMSLGANSFAQLTPAFNQIRDPEIQSYAEEVCSRLVGKTPGPNYTYKVTVVDSAAVNAVTMPGHIIVFAGLFMFSDNESEFAGVLAHELAHNYGHHAARRFIKAYQAQALADAVTALARTIDPRNQQAQVLTQILGRVGVGLFLNAYSRHEEKEADLYGAHILFNAGYNPTAMSLSFLKMYKLNPKQPVKFLSTHPPIQDRADYITDYLESFPLERELRIDSEAFQKIKQRFAPPQRVIPVIPPPH